LKTQISGIVYDTHRSEKLAHKATISTDAQLFQTREGLFFLLVLQLYADDRKLGPEESWTDLRHTPDLLARLKVAAEIKPLTSREALEWAIKTQIPETFRGYLLEAI
jgi:hypothetical protein